MGGEIIDFDIIIKNTVNSFGWWTLVEILGFLQVFAGADSVLLCVELYAYYCP